ncbi:acid phosphatase 1-like [Magnolia sinica]|uniref:acid phosphatase 1-like n=1 Tax=Magnolia sinica TaxID=86752 RepID=UPI00265820AB|nr:acid phosphatase 1-like [Magnolia sinica]
MEALAILFLTTIVATSHASDLERGGIPLPIHLLRPLTGSRDLHIHGISCSSWRLAVETNNIRDWTTVPQSCENYVGHYMLGHLYREDSKMVADTAASYAANLTLGGDGKKIWVFDIDETVLSNLPYYAQHGFGVQPYDNSLFQAWVDLGEAPALPESLKLYKKLIKLGIKIVFLTGRSESKREITEKNLKKAGFHSWEKLILRQATDTGSALVYKTGKRKELQAEGCIIVGNSGDQWSDILGTPTGLRTFKVPDPMYYIG